MIEGRDSRIFFSESTEAVAQNLQEVKPTMMIAVPRLYEVLYGRIMNGVRAKGGVSELLFMNAVKLGRKKLSGNFLLPHEWLFDKILDVLVTYQIKPEIFKYHSNKLKWIHIGASGIEENLFEDILKSKVMITNAKGINSKPVAEFVMSQIMYFAKNLNKCNRFKLNKIWLLP